MNKTSKEPSCAMCERPVEVDYRPFCSKRCADQDLGKWFNGSYAITGEPADQAESNPYSDKNAE